LKTVGIDDASVALTKPKPKKQLKKKANDDPFASDDNDDEGQEHQGKEEMQSKMVATKSKRQDIDDGVEEKRSKNKKPRKL
jgi:hypothetical protein